MRPRQEAIKFESVLDRLDRNGFWEFSRVAPLEINCDL